MTTASERRNASRTFPTSTVLSPRLLRLCRRLRGALAGVCVAMLLIGAMSAPAQTQSVMFEGVQTTVPVSGLQSPGGVAVDAAGDVFIADTNNSRVVEVPAGGGAQTTVGFGLSYPRYVAVDHAGDVFISDYGNNRIVEVPVGCTSAACQTTVGFGEPQSGDNFVLGVAVDGAGNIFFSADGDVTKVPAGCTSAYCEVLLLRGDSYGLAVDGADNVFLSQGSSTYSLAELPAGCTSSDCLINLVDTNDDPSVGGVAVDKSGNVYFTNSQSSQLLELPAGCTTTTCQILVGSGSGLTNSNGLAVDGVGDFFVAQSNQLVKLQPHSVNYGSVGVGSSETFTFPYTVNSTTTFGTPKVVTQGAPNLDFTLASGSNTCTGTISAGGTCTMSVTFAPLAPGVRAGAVQLFDSSGNLLVSTMVHGIGQGPAVAFSPSVQTVIPASGLNNPGGVAVDGAGDVFIADPYYNNRVVEVTPAGVQTTVGSGLNSPSGVAVDGAGDVFIADTVNNRVVEVTSAGIQTVVNNGVSQPNGVAVDGAGDVFITDSNNRVVEVTPGGVETTVPASGLSLPEAVAVDGAGDVFIADYFNNRVVEVTPSGVQTTVGSGLNSPEGVAVDGAGDVFIADNFNNRVVEVTPAGVQTTVGSGLSRPSAVAVDGKGDVFISDIVKVQEVNRSIPPTMSFAATNIGQTSSDSPQSFTLQNIGNQVLGANAPGLVVNGPNFVEVEGPGTPEDCGLGFSASPLAPGASCNLSISFEPQSMGALSSIAVFTDNALNISASQTIQLQGVGTQKAQTISFALPPSETALTTVTLIATATSGLTVTFQSTTPSVCTVSGTTAQFLTAGTCTIIATQPGNATYQPAPSVPQTTSVKLATQTITFTPLGSETAGTTATLGATSSSNGAVTFASTTPAICTVSGAKASFLTSGSCTLTVSVPSNTVYAAASTSQTVTVTLAKQTITFAKFPASQLQGTSLALSATASSGLVVSFTSLTPAACAISGSTATLLQAGTCTIQASQSGNAIYAAAPAVSQSLTVIAAFTITPNPAEETIYRGNVAAFLLQLKAASGFTGKVTLSCSGGPVGSYCADFPMTVSFKNGTAQAISGVFFPATTTPGTYTLTFTGVSGSITNRASATFIVEAKH